MTKLLVITAHPAPVEYSKSRRVAEKFVDTYVAQNPNTEVTKINLYDLDAPDVDRVVYSAFGHLMNGGSFETLTTEQQQALGKRQEVITQFMEHDRYVFVSPMWEFSFPAVLKKYLDIVCAARQTFQYNELGMPVGLLTGKKAIYIQASGGNHTKDFIVNRRPLIAQHENATVLLPTFDTFGNYGEPIVRATLAIMGVLDYQHIMVHSQSMPHAAEDSFNASLQQAEQAASQW